MHIEHLTSQQQFRATVEGRSCVLDYHLRAGVLVITHTEVARALRGRGIGAALMREVLDHAQRHGLKVHPACSYASAYMNDHPQTAALRV